MGWRVCLALQQWLELEVSLQEVGEGVEEGEELNLAEGVEYLVLEEGVELGMH